MLFRSAALGISLPGRMRFTCVSCLEEFIDAGLKSGCGLLGGRRSDGCPECWRSNEKLTDIHVSESYWVGSKAVGNLSNGILRQRRVNPEK